MKDTNSVYRPLWHSDSEGLLSCTFAAVYALITSFRLISQLSIGLFFLFTLPISPLSVTYAKGKCPNVTLLHTYGRSASLAYFPVKTFTAWHAWTVISNRDISYSSTNKVSEVTLTDVRQATDEADVLVDRNLKWMCGKTRKCWERERHSYRDRDRDRDIQRQKDRDNQRQTEK